MTLVPFVNTPVDRDLLPLLDSASMVRTSPMLAAEVQRVAPQVTVWIDGQLDGFHHWPNCADRWRELMSKCKGWEKIADPRFQERPKKETVEGFVNALLEECRKAGADWISVPQLPVNSERRRNALNRQLASATGKWRAESGFKGTLVLPVILQKPVHVDRVATRRIAVDLAGQCFSRSGAAVLWAAVVGLDDQSGSKQLTDRRFPGVVSLHQELAKKVPTASAHVGGPYWALNLVLWARGLITHMATGLGTGYLYQPPGLYPLRRGKHRVALPPFRRTAVAGPALEDWFQEVAGILPSSEPTAKELAAVAKRLTTYLENSRAARRQVVRFYRDWHAMLMRTKAPGRSLALYQDLSEAFVLGRSRRLPQLSDGGTARRPERVAEQLMTFCLPEG